MKRYTPYVLNASLDDAVCDFWEKQGLPKGEELDALIARQPPETMSAWRTFLAQERDDWEWEAGVARQNARDAESGPRGDEDDIGEHHHLLHDEALDNASACQTMIDMAADS